LKSNITSCAATVDGGAIYFYQNNYKFTATSSYFVNNTARGTGGALMFNTNNFYISIEYSTFIKNYAGEEGGAIRLYSFNDYAHIVSVIFQSNRAGLQGGTLSLVFENQYFQMASSSILISSAGNYGGGIYVDSGNHYLSVTGITISNVTAQEGGGLLMNSNNQNASLTGVTFRFCHATINGSAIQLYGADFVLTLYSNRFLYCTKSLSVAIIGNNLNTVYQYSQPTSQPSSQPTWQPTGQPTVMPSIPTSIPSHYPSSQSTLMPISFPSSQPISFPSSHPSSQPTKLPTSQPSCFPSLQPTSFPTSRPTEIPPCPAGQFNRFIDNGKNRTCLDCPAGTYSSGISPICISCPLNYYQPNTRSTACITCGVGYITAGTGTINKAQCVNPTSSFVVGGLSLAFAAVVFLVYVCMGRLQQLAIHRKHNLVRESFIIYGALARFCDLIASENLIIQHIRSLQNNQPWKRLSRIALLVVIVTLFVPAILILSIASSAMAILFNVVVIWRGYRYLYNLSLTDLFHRMNYFVDLISQAIGYGEIIQMIAYPFIYVFIELAQVNFNFVSVQISCDGSKAPLSLLFDLLILGVIVVVIESDVQVFWVCAFNNALAKLNGLIMSRHYMSSYQRTAFSQFFCSILLSFFPQPHRLIQYVLGSLTLTAFFADDGHNAINSNCNSATSIPMDTILAYSSTIFAGIFFFPTVYVIAQVLVPCFYSKKKEQHINEKEINDHSCEDSSDDEDKVEEYEYDSTESKEVEANDQTQMQPHFTYIIQHLSFQLYSIYIKVAVFFALDCYFLRSICAFANSVVKTHCSYLKMSSEILETELSEGITENADRIKFNIERLHQIYLEAKHSILKTLPWHFAADPPRTSKKSGKLNIQYPTYSYCEFVDEVYLDLWKRFPSWLSKSKMSLMRNLIQFICHCTKWLFPFQYFQSRTGRKTWDQVIQNYAMFLLISIGNWSDLSASEYELEKRFEIMTNRMKKVQKRSLRHELLRGPSGFFLLSKEELQIGQDIGNDADADHQLDDGVRIDELPTISNSSIRFVSTNYEDKSGFIPDDFDHMEEIIASSSPSRSRYSNPTSRKLLSNARYKHIDSIQSTISRISNSEDINFLQFMSAIVSPRVVLLQMIPIFTLWSIIAVDTSICPLFVRSPILQKKIPCIAPCFSFSRSSRSLVH
jgi:hypothetical protein